MNTSQHLRSIVAKAIEKGNRNKRWNYMYSGRKHMIQR